MQHENSILIRDKVLTLPIIANTIDGISSYNLNSIQATWLSKLNFDVETNRIFEKVLTCQYQCVYVFTIPNNILHKHSIFGFDSKGAREG